MLYRSLESYSASTIFSDAGVLANKRMSTKGPVMAETALPWKRYYDGKYSSEVNDVSFSHVPLVNTLHGFHS